MSKEIVEETIESFLEFLPKVIDASKNTAELFHSDREATALQDLIQIIDAYTWIIEAVHGIQKNGFLSGINLAEMTDYLKQVEQAIEIQDYVTVSDILEYEVTALLEDWYVLLSQEGGPQN